MNWEKGKIMKTLITLLAMLLLALSGLIQAGPIHEAIETGELAGVKAALAENPKAVNEKNSENNTPLHLAAMNGHLEISKALITAGADVNAGDNENSPPIVNAALGAHYDVVKLLLKKGASATLKDDNEMTPLHFAAMGGNAQIIKLLLDKGADVNALNNSQLTPLIYAAYRGRTEASRVLVENGADPKLASEDGKTVLHGAANNGSVETCEFFIEQGIDINATDNHGRTPIFDAAERGRTEALSLLIEHGANIHAVDSNGISPLHDASYSGTPELIDLFIKAGVDPNLADNLGRRPMHFAMWRSQTESVRALLAHGADPNLTDNRGHAPLYDAVKSGSPEICELLLANKADINVREQQHGRTPLHLACIKGYKEIAALLVAGGADLTAKDNSGNSPLHFAGRYGHKSTAKLLMANGAKADKMEKNFGVSPLLTKPLQNKEAVVWYTGHAGWAVKTANHLLLFDYWEGDSRPTDPCLSNGYINPDEIKDLPVTVFCSHSHRDHYDPTVFEWQGAVSNINYVYGFEPDSAPQYHFTGPRKETTIDGIKISTITSNDEGVGFLIQTDGLTIFHGGDHANRQRDFSGPFSAEIDYLADKNVDIDLAFMSISGCGFGDLEAVKLGVYYTLEKLTPGVFFPQHAVDNEYRYREFTDEAAEKNFKSKFMCAENKGDRFIYQNGRVAF
jgi:ankyrin repeat protein